MSVSTEKQHQFAVMLARLILWAHDNGHIVTMGEAFRTPTEAAANAAKGTGILRSLHCDRLACDLNLIVDGVYQKKSEAYTALGEYWETELGGAWGGRWGDGNHFSLAHEGRK